MRSGIGWLKVLVRVVLPVATILLTVVSCGVQDSSDNADPPPLYASERERLLATCPAKAQDFFAWQQELAEQKGLERPVEENDIFLDSAASVVQNYLLTLPADQRGGVGIDSVRDQIIVQVTHGKDEVLADLRKQVDDPENITVEVVRWSEKDLSSFADRLETLRGSDS